MREAITVADATVIYLPPDSPDFNLIELVFSKLKLLLSSTIARTVEGLWNLFGQLLDQFPRERSVILSHLQHGGSHLALSRDHELTPAVDAQI